MAVAVLASAAAALAVDSRPLSWVVAVTLAVLPGLAIVCLQPHSTPIWPGQEPLTLALGATTRPAAAARRTQSGGVARCSASHRSLIRPCGAASDEFVAASTRQITRNTTAARRARNIVMRITAERQCRS
jgi:hypothetical protein